MAGRLRAFLQGIRPRPTLISAILLLAVSLLVLSLAIIWVGALYLRQQVAEQVVRENTTPEETQPEEFPLVFNPEASPNLAETTTAGGRRSGGIPGLSSVDVATGLKYLSGTDFRCSGSSPDRGMSKEVCRSSSEEDSAVYEVTILSESATVVRWVQATAYDAPEDKAAEVLGYVARISLPDTDSINAEAWVNRNISPGGQYFAKGAELRLYGSEKARTLEIVGSEPTTSRSLRPAETTTKQRTIG